MPQSVLQSPVVYSKQFTTGTAGTGTPAFTANTTAGSCLLLAVSLFTTALGPTITSVTTNGAAENWIFLYQDPDGYVLCYINPATAGGQTTIDINVSFGGTASTSNSMVLLAKLWEDGGLGPAVIADVSQSANNIGTSFASNSGTADTTTQADEIWHAAMGLAVNAANTTSTASQTSGGWTDSALGGSSYQSGGTGTADKFNVYLLRRRRIRVRRGPGVDGSRRHRRPHLRPAPVGTPARGRVPLRLHDSPPVAHHRRPADPAHRLRGRYHRGAATAGGAPPRRPADPAHRLRGRYHRGAATAGRDPARLRRGRDRSRARCPDRLVGGQQDSLRTIRPRQPPRWPRRFPRRDRNRCRQHGRRRIRACQSAQR